MMLSLQKLSAVSLLSLAGSVFAHGGVTTIAVNGVKYTGYAGSSSSITDLHHAKMIIAPLLLAGGLRTMGRRVKSLPSDPTHPSTLS